MASNEVEIEQSKTTGLKHFRFLNEIMVKFLVLLSNIYDFAKENSSFLKPTFVSVETSFVSVVGPVYEKLKELPEQIIVFVDEKFDKYAPSLAKNLVAAFQSLIDKATPLVQKLLTAAQPVITPLITTTISLLQKLLVITIPLIQEFLTAIKSAPLVGRAQSLLQKGLTMTQSFLESSPLVKSAQSILQTTLNQALDKTKSIVGGIPLMGNVAQSLITTNPIELYNQLVNSPIFGAVSSATQNFVKVSQTAGTKAALQSIYMSLKLVGVPVIAQMWYKVNTHAWFNALAEPTLPVVEYLSELYNKVVIYMDGRGYSLFGYLPSLPIDEMKVAYKLVNTTMDGLSAVGNLAGDLIGMNDNNNT
ncbi:hypothetical protein E3N88_40693 [Mikania micrantha]|uniref:Rubber elongation factor n=1 Tax=Mikania micrantha TaxID=192012 RepID=A0A5N6LNJ4_9ASTR|nr:hypothetical protein E3N88_40693 [Mikania micrantha]